MHLAFTAMATIHIVVEHTRCHDICFSYMVGNGAVVLVCVLEGTSCGFVSWLETYV